MIIGNDIKKYLIKRLNENQPGKSSHWIKLLQDSSFSEKDGFKNIKGFGNIIKKNIRNKIFHNIMQFPYKYNVKKNFDIFNTYKNAIFIANKQNRLLDLDILRQVFTISLCKKMIPNFLQLKNHLVIGDGFGVLSSLIILEGGKKVISINLNEVLLVDYIYTRKIISDNSTVLIKDSSDLQTALEKNEINLIYIQANNHSILHDIKINTSFNIVSMQEMNHNIIKQYFDILRNCKSRSLYFYCCNRIQKTLPDKTKIMFLNYPWADSDEILVDELCPWHQKYYSIKPPFYHSYDGLIQHRLVKINNQKN